ncbi:hypothetical protein EVG20_g8207 [Dentipellis fragilis]|uniref:Uncharacterized protein n=1 Tax=Dentipellis fragilis TaxID=205917 RepID=A0A4Y9Y7Z5_9AGAM|nr:hypothetical protein EVG20_g8207 [Dentipellis fragilis]
MPPLFSSMLIMPSSRRRSALGPAVFGLTFHLANPICHHCFRGAVAASSGSHNPVMTRMQSATRLFIPISLFFPSPPHLATYISLSIFFSFILLPSCCLCFSRARSSLFFSIIDSFCILHPRPSRLLLVPVPVPLSGSLVSFLLPPPRLPPPPPPPSAIYNVTPTRQLYDDVARRASRFKPHEYIFLAVRGAM